MLALARVRRVSSGGKTVKVPVDQETWELIERYKIDVVEAVKRHLEWVRAKIASRAPHAR